MLDQELEMRRCRADYHSPGDDNDTAHAEGLARISQCAVKSHGSPVGETKQTHPGTNRSARNRLEG
jgi:hypothetical protein